MDEQTAAQIKRIAEVTREIQGIFRGQSLTVAEGDLVPLATTIVVGQIKAAQKEQGGPPGKTTGETVPTDAPPTPPEQANPAATAPGVG